MKNIIDIYDVAGLTSVISDSEKERFGVAVEATKWSKTIETWTAFMTKEELFRQLLRPVYDDEEYVYNVFIDGEHVQLKSYKGRADVMKMISVDAIIKQLEKSGESHFGYVCEWPERNEFDVSMRTKEEIYADLLWYACGIKIVTIYTGDKSFQIRWEK